MKPEQIIEVVQGFMDGKTIQWSTSNQAKWEDCAHVVWAFNINDYRIKPFPRKLTFIHKGTVDMDGYKMYFIAEEGSVFESECRSDIEVIETIEVLEDE